MKIDYKLIGQRIRDVRKSKNITQDELAEKMDVSVVYLSRVERGSTSINLPRLAQISEILCVSIEYLIAGSVRSSKTYLNKELAEILKNCTPAKQRLVYEIAKMVEESENLHI